MLQAINIIGVLILGYLIMSLIEIMQQKDKE